MAKAVAKKHAVCLMVIKKNKTFSVRLCPFIEY